MATAKDKKTEVTLTKDGREITLSTPREIVQFKAAGWREGRAEDAEKEQAKAPEAPAEKAPADSKGASKK